MLQVQGATFLTKKWFSVGQAVYGQVVSGKRDFFFLSAGETGSGHPKCPDMKLKLQISTFKLLYPCVASKNRSYQLDS